MVLRNWLELLRIRMWWETQRGRRRQRRRRSRRLPAEVLEQRILLSNVQIIDNRAAVGFSETGNWTYVTGSGYAGDRQHSTTGTARWSFDVVPGTYRVAATWFGNSAWTTVAPYELRDGVGGPVLGTVTVNQQVTPHEFTEGGVSWQTLATVTVTGQTLEVFLLDAPSGNQFADAIRIERVFPVLVQPGQTLSVEEHAELGTVAGTLSGSALTGTLQEWQIVGGSGASLFLIDPQTGVLTVAEPLDYELASSYTLLVTVSNGTDLAPPDMGDHRGDRCG